MMKYTLAGHGGHVTVTAANESDARHAAMTKMWGPRPSEWGGSHWYGEGLSIVACEAAK